MTAWGERSFQPLRTLHYEADTELEESLAHAFDQLRSLGLGMDSDSTGAAGEGDVLAAVADAGSGVRCADRSGDDRAPGGAAESAAVRITVPLASCGELGRVLYEQDVSVCLLERTGTGWIVELMKPAGAGLESALLEIGATLLRNGHH